MSVPTIAPYFPFRRIKIVKQYLRVTHRLALYIHQLCQFMTVSDVAKHVKLDWKTVKNIDKYHLEAKYGQPDYNNLKILAVDEIAVRKGHNYLTVVLDYLSGRIVFIGKDRKAKTLKRFFNQMTAKQRKSIDAVAMDMWDPFINAVKKKYLKRKSCSICSMLWPSSVRLSIKFETVNIVSSHQCQQSCSC